MLWFSKVHFRKSNKVLWKAKRKWPSSALSEWKLFVKALSCDFFFFFMITQGYWSRHQLAFEGSCDFFGLSARNFNLLFSAKFWYIMGLTHIEWFDEGYIWRVPPEQQHPEPFCNVHIWWSAVSRLYCCWGKKLHLYCRVPMGPGSLCVNDLNVLSHHIKLAMTFSLEQIEVWQQNYTCIIVVKINCSLLTS